YHTQAAFKTGVADTLEKISNLKKGPPDAKFWAEGRVAHDISKAGEAQLDKDDVSKFASFPGNLGKRAQQIIGVLQKQPHEVIDSFVESYRNEAKTLSAIRDRLLKDQQ